MLYLIDILGFQCFSSKLVDLAPYLVLLSQEEGDEAYLETYEGENEGDYETDTQDQEFEAEADLLDEESETKPEFTSLIADRLETQGGSFH